MKKIFKKLRLLLLSIGYGIIAIASDDPEEYCTQTAEIINHVMISKLKDIDVGKYVDYHHLFDNTIERGRIKSWNAKLVFVVFECNGKWDRYREYTGEACLPEHLTFI